MNDISQKVHRAIEIPNLNRISSKNRTIYIELVHSALEETKKSFTAYLHEIIFTLILLALGREISHTKSHTKGQ